MTERRVGSGDNTEGSRDGDGRTDGSQRSSYVYLEWQGCVRYGRPLTL